MSSYEELRDKLVAGRAEQAAIITSNQEVLEKIKSEVHKLLELDITAAEMSGVDIGVIRGLDFDRIVVDNEYYESVKAALNSSITQLYDLLEGVLG